MKKLLVLSAFALAFVCVTGCCRKAVKEEPMPAPAVVELPAVAVPALPEEPAVDPKVQAAQQKYWEGLRQYDRADYRGAMKTWEDCIKLDPRNEDCKAGYNAAKNMIDSMAAKRK